MRYSTSRLLSGLYPTRAQHSSVKGFTLTELLVVLIIGSIIVTTLLSLVNELLKTSQRETAKSETQRDMQMSLDYIASDLREAAYVYDSTCHSVPASTTSCPSYTNFVPAEMHRPTGAYPRSQAILGFWKVDPLSVEDIQSVEAIPNCTAAFATVVLRQECNQVQRQKRSFTLVVYSQQWDDPTSTTSKWKGKSRIIRYQLKKYANLQGPLNTRFARKQGYVDPLTDVGVPIFRAWPYRPGAPGAADINCQANPTAALPGGCAITGALVAGRPTGSGDIQVLSDFLDDALPANGRDLPNPICPVGSYSMGPRNANVLANTPTAAQNVEANLASKSFFVCVRGQQLPDGTIQQPELGQVQDIVVFLRGNAYGRARFLQDAYLPTLQTTITLRGIINKEPS
jgi:prepilin-type N-terminal cleavage/methylation domain-containing protein